jgi:hypothetical protein
MVTDEERELLEQIDSFLALPSQSWLFGAGISCEVGIPLMYPLTNRVMELVAGGVAEGILTAFRAELPDDCHIEHLLSHLGDYCALAVRSRDQTAQIGGQSISIADLELAHGEILQHISNTIRWGYKKSLDPAGQPVWIAGTRQTPLVKVDDHLTFAQAVFRRGQAGLQQRRGAVRIFTTNYDTLIEDSLALAGVSCWDGFSGGALAYRSHRFGDPEPAGGFRAHLIKLHGSIDWHLSPQGDICRIRDGDLYPDRTGRVLIYPQATKYVATQKDPFAAQFELLRRTLSSKNDNVLGVCGYSFGDEHINQEIEMGLSRYESKTTMIVLLLEGNALPACIEKWRNAPWGRRIYIVTEKGIYAGANPLVCSPAQGASHAWWTFSGLTRTLVNGLGSFVA